MENLFNNKINILKALAIMIIVSGHLEFSLIPMFPPYSFHLALFFFISGYLFKEKYLENVFEFLKKKSKTLLVPYYLYIVFYFLVTCAIFKLTGRFWGYPITLKNYTVIPFINGHQLDLACPLWFVLQLFITLVCFLFTLKFLKKIYDNKWFHFAVFLVLALISMTFGECKFDSPILILVRTLFSMFFVYFGFFYKNNIEGKRNIFSPKIIFFMIALQSLLWFLNKDYTPSDGIGLSYILVWGDFDSFLVPILTSITGIWASLFVVEVLYPYLKDNKFIYQIGQNTYHIMANHLFVFYLITVILMWLKGVPIEVKNEHDIYWIYAPLKTTYFYFVVTIYVTTYVGAGLKALKKKFFAKIL